MTPDEQEALSRKYSDEAIIVLPLEGGSFAVFNRSFELCAIVPRFAEARLAWHRPKPPPKPKLKTTLEELGLL